MNATTATIRATRMISTSGVKGPQACVLEPFEVRKNDGHQLQDDRGSDVRHDAEGEDREAAEVAAAEEIEETQNRSRRLCKEPLQFRDVDPRRPDVRANAIHRQEGQREQYAIPQVFDAEHVLHCFDESVHACFLRLSTAP